MTPRRSTTGRRHPVDASMTSPTPVPVVASGHLPRDLSPWSMFMAADWLVKAVMLSLIFASFVTWTMPLGCSASRLAIR